MEYQKVTSGIKVVVKPRFERIAMVDKHLQHIFSYEVHIENNSDKTVQLLKRKWIIQNTLGDKRLVEGHGVIGKQPILAPGDAHSYTSWTPLITPIGKMKGHYLMQQTEQKRMMKVVVPEFLFCADFTLN